MEVADELDAAASGSIPAGRRVAGVEESWGRAAAGAPVTGGGGDGGGAVGGRAGKFSEERLGLPASFLGRIGSCPRIAIFANSELEFR